MNEETFNLDLRKFLKKFGVAAQREIELEVRDAMETGLLKGDEPLSVRARLEIDGIGEVLVVEGIIGLE